MKFKSILMAIMLSFLLPIPAHAAPISLNIKEMNLHDAIMMVANIGNLNVSFNFDSKINDNELITISLNNVEAVDALNIIAKTKDLKIINENGIFIITNDHKNVAIMNIYVLPVRYGDIEEIRKAVVLSLDNNKNNDDDMEALRLYLKSSSNDKELSNKIYESLTDWLDYTQKDKNNKRIVINRDTNALVLYGTITEYERAQLLLKNLDVPLKQVALEAKVLALNKSASKDLGVEWKWSELPQYPDYTPATTTTNGNVTTQTEGYYTRKHVDNVFGVLQFGRLPEGTSYEWYYGAKLNALVTNGKAKILSRPNITTIQGREAIIDIGSKVPVQTTSTTNSTVTTSYEYRDAGIILRCNPHINEDGSITVNVYTEVSTPQYVPDLKAYSFLTRTAVTNVTLKDGEPMIIGGLIGKEEEKSISKIPFLGDLPILGELFKNRRNSKSESELMIFLTARVIK